jgi:hypothetical protein
MKPARPTDYLNPTTRLPGVGHGLHYGVEANRRHCFTPLAHATSAIESQTFNATGLSPSRVREIDTRYGRCHFI